MRIGQIAGVDVLLSTTWFLFAGLVAVVAAPWVEEAEPGLGAGKYVAGLVIAVVVALTILLHEASHALMAKHYGHSVDSITLHFLGGHTSMEGEARSAREEFLVAVVGPLTSIAAGLVALLVSLVAPGGLIGMTLAVVAWANIVIGVLNLVPGLPLDGGRVLKALVWGVTGNPHRGTLLAGWIGRLLAVAVLVWPFVQDSVLGTERTTSERVIDLMVAGVLALFLWSSATAAMQSARLRRRLPSIVARDLARSTLTVPDDLPVAEAVRRAQDAEAGSIVTVSSSGEPLGIVNEAALLATPEERRPWLAVSTLARTLERGMTLPASIVGEDLIRAITFLPAHEYLLVEDDGRIFGVLATADVDRAFRQRHH